jgi:threonine/homoserine/homoserine lactone efflux protein
MTPAVFIALAATVAVTAVTPGPAVTAIVARAMVDGVKPAMALNAGVITGDLLFFALAAAGMAAAAKSMGDVFAVIRWLGAAYLAWQGVKMLRTPSRSLAPAGSPQAAVHESHLWRNYGAGLLLMFGHVQMILFYAALLPGFIDFDAMSPTDFVLVGLMLVVVLGGVNAAYAVLAARARGFFANERAQRALHCTAGCLMLFAAVLVATR